MLLLFVLKERVQDHETHGHLLRAVIDRIEIGFQMGAIILLHIP